MRRGSVKGSVQGSNAGGSLVEDDMNNIGLNLGVGQQDLKRIHEKRIRKGECPSCGVKCYKVTGNLLGKKKRIPLTIAGHVKDGVCLTCYPLAAHGNQGVPAGAAAAGAGNNTNNNNAPPMPQNATAMPAPSTEFTVPVYINDDNQSVVSGITLDHRLWSFPGEEQFTGTARENRWKHDVPRQSRNNMNFNNNNSNNNYLHDLEPPMAATRPEPSSNGFDADDRPQLPRRKGSDRSGFVSRESTPSSSFKVQMEDRFVSTQQGRHPFTVDEMAEFEAELVDDEDEEEDEEEKLSEQEEENRRNRAYYPPAIPCEIEESVHGEGEIFFDSKRRLLDASGRDDDDEPEEDSFIEAAIMSPRSAGSRKSGGNREITVDPRTLPIELEMPPPFVASPAAPAALAARAKPDPNMASRPPTRHLNSSGSDEYSAPPPAPNQRSMASQPRKESIGVEAPRMPNRDEPRDTPRMPIRKQSGRGARGNPEMGRMSSLTDRSFGTPTSQSPEGSVSRGSLVPALLQSLEEARDSATRVDALEQLKDSLMDVEAKHLFCSSRGVNVINRTIWVDIADPDVQQACLDLLLALVAKADKDEPDFLTGEDGQNVIDALLIVMQRLQEDEEIQGRGCRVLGCLARASKKNNAVSDGSASGAVLAILNAMEKHRGSKGVTEWGVRTLYEFCSHSRNAEANKRNLWSQPLASGTPGWSLLLNALSVSPEDAVGLLWVLSSDEDGLEQLQPANGILLQLFRLLQKYQKDRLSSLLIEASLGCISNFATVDTNLGQVDATDICILALSLIPVHMRSATSLCTEACAVVASLASVANKTTIVDQGGIDDLCLAMTEFHNDEALHEEAVNALLALMRDSAHIKEAATATTTFSTLMKLFRTYESSAKWQTSACQLFASLFAIDGVLPVDLERDGLSAVCFAMTLHSTTEKVQESGCVALSNLSGRPGSIECLATSDAVELALLAMQQFPRNLTVQIMTCVTLWNMEYRSAGDTGDVNAIQCIVKAIQNHIESERLLEVACGALLHLIYGSDSHKMRVAQEGGVEAMACTLVMYAQSIGVLEKVCEVMASLSACRSLANSIIRADCIGAMVEILRNTDSICVYRSGALFLKNVVVAKPEVCEEAARGLTTIVKAMQLHKNDPDFQREACNYLWTVAALSEDSRSKILALDGISVVMDTLEVYQDTADVQQAAFGAFHQLAQ